MSPMEKNTEPSGSVVETFKAYFSGHCLRGTDAFGVCIYSDQSPLGWRLGLKCRAGKGITGKPKMNFLFDPKSVNPRLGRLYISIDVREEHALQYRELVEAFEVQALPDVSPSKIGSWEISGSCLAIRFTVAWGPGRTRLSKSEPEGPVRSVAMQKSLADSMQDGQFLDTRFFAYSKRRHLGRVDTPLPVYANSELLKDKSPYFTTLLSSEDFSECSLNVLEGGFPKDQQSFFDDYDYGSDSDLEDETLFQEETCDSEPAALLSAEAQARSPGNARDIGLVHSSEK
ncbi:hypothetical protein GLOTRDRAFT_120638 [Gloeophyllum trabeum ATCC 11539]|uniref:Uncharacterized protein n=1 Tax=Gloeophyllum trabeum (strain ATCC 11539 / FP-39264 / Madison 617) TaxID=670483 RepID=S7QDL9_GLOTA|nr:uncharacterized protein GLOTRDRAFT_120638 [Gloeophyllum trabeum ATCC 11539]EPQ57478.1 hypothetical protein GLOTRDRAFT_120638 [Gloeophyllum trabeum ATCC 11539]